MWIQTGVTVRKRLNGLMTSVTLTFDLWPWPFTWTSLLSLVITPDNFMMIWWWEHSQKGVTDGQTDGRTDRRTDGKYHSLSCLVAAKKILKWFCVADATFSHHMLLGLPIIFKHIKSISFSVNHTTLPLHYGNEILFVLLFLWRIAMCRGRYNFFGR